MPKSNRHSPEPSPAHLRCAIYTRKSTEEGLEQEFNSVAKTAPKLMCRWSGCDRFTVPSLHVSAFRSLSPGPFVIGRTSTVGGNPGPLAGRLVIRTKRRHWRVQARCAPLRES
jgi:hypothetical protein